jgi:hypothetical protein
MTQVDHERYVRASGRLSITALYDPITAITMREHAGRGPFCKQILAVVPDGGTIVEVGAGTGAVAIRLASAERVHLPLDYLRLNISAVRRDA